MPLFFAGQVIDRLVEWGVGGDGDSRIGLKTRSGEDVDLNPGAILGRVGRGRSAMEDQYWQIQQKRVGCVVEIDLVWRQSQVVGDSNHGEVVDRAWIDA